jgi:DNA-binding transcriptional MerR regulator
MASGKILRINRHSGTLFISLIITTIGWLPSYTFGDEIQFKDKGVHVGTVLEEDEQSVTVRFPREAIRSIVKTSPGTPPARKSDQQILEKLEQLQQRIEGLEKKQAEPKQTGVSPKIIPRSEGKQESGGTGGTSSPGLSKKATVHERLLQEELGSVRGVIFWRGKPLVNGKVRIELEQYTGVSLASVKKMLSGKEQGSPETDQGISLTTQTDSKGRYAFGKVPPGSYRLYWSPDLQTDWYHRLREKPDFEVLSGRETVQNIPGKLTISNVTEKK